MTDSDTDDGDDTTDDKFDGDLSLEARDPDEDRGDAPVSGCLGCGREVTLLSNGYCGKCQHLADDPLEPPADAADGDGGDGT